MIVSPKGTGTKVIVSVIWEIESALSHDIALLNRHFVS